LSGDGQLRVDVRRRTGHVRRPILKRTGDRAAVVPGRSVFVEKSAIDNVLAGPPSPLPAQCETLSPESAVLVLIV